VLSANISFGCGPELELHSQTRASDLVAGGQILSLPCRITLSILLQPHLEEGMKVYPREKKYAAKAGGKPESSLLHRPAVIHMLRRHGRFWRRPRPSDGTVEITT